MTRDDTMKLLQECGFGTLMDHPILTENMMRFAALVAAAEREACAETCDETRFTGYCPPEYGIARDYYDAAAEHCAAAIRARGEV